MIMCYTFFSLNTRFGVVAVPTVLLFHSGKPVLKFNNSFSFDDLKEFVKNNTGMYRLLCLNLNKRCV